MTTMDDPALDNPVWTSLTGRHAHLAEFVGQAARYRTDVAPFVAFADDPDERVWTDLAALVGSGGSVPLAGLTLTPPADWEQQFLMEGVQLIDRSVVAAPDSEAVPLGAVDVPEMLDLVARTQPGPFLVRTVEMGRYLGIRRDGRLVAMAGERLQPPGWVEISAVCTDPAYRGQGLATRLVKAVAHGIREQGMTPFLHAAATNTNAIRLYESLGFVLRRRTTFIVVRAPTTEQ